jgi:ADP-dependent NAD(P)H-hydrate dehydratase / NAD(P)H-hydrate epimerase
VLPVVTPDHMRAIDAAAPGPVTTLIERAGAAVAREALAMLGGAYGRTIVVLAGPGNNGADGRVAAGRLRERGALVRVYDVADVPAVLPPVDLVIDAAFGTGFRGTWTPPAVGGARVLAVDVPTGLDALTGTAPATTLRAERTITFAAAKPGQLVGDGPELCGQLVVADIGLDVSGATMGIVEHADLASAVPVRQRDAHKWQSAVRIVAGSPGMTGAAALASGACQRTGAGMVVTSVPGADATDLPVEAVGRRLPPFDWDEAVLSDLHRFEVLVIGPGLGRADHTVPSIVRTVTRALVPIVIDGDGLFAMSWNEAGTPAFLRDRIGPTVLTPHDGEYALLIGSSPGRDRVAAARRLVDVSGSTVLLKGPTTIVAAPDGRVRFVVNGDQRLATAGTGDVLAGIIGGLIARGVDAFDAAALGAFVHAEAGNALPPHGLVAGDLIGEIPGVLNRTGA